MYVTVGDWWGSFLNFSWRMTDRNVDKLNLNIAVTCESNFPSPNPLCSKVCDMFIKILLISSILEFLKNQIELSISGTWCRVLRAWKCACGTVFMTVLDSGFLTVYICNCRRVSVFNKDWFVSCRRRPAAVSSLLFIIFFCWQLYWSSRILVVMVTDMLYSPPRLIGPHC